MAEKINTFLVNDQLYADYNQKDSSIFSHVWRNNDEEIAMLNDLNYEVNLLSNQIYSVTISAEFCGSYCENYATTYNFDLISGNKLKLDTLLTETGKKMLVDTLNLYKSNAIQTKLNEIENHPQYDY